MPAFRDIPRIQMRCSFAWTSHRVLMAGRGLADHPEVGGFGSLLSGPDSRFRVYSSGDASASSCPPNSPAADLACCDGLCRRHGWTRAASETAQRTFWGTICYCGLGSMLDPFKLLSATGVPNLARRRPPSATITGAGCDRETHLPRRFSLRRAPVVSREASEAPPLRQAFADSARRTVFGFREPQYLSGRGLVQLCSI